MMKNMERRNKAANIVYMIFAYGIPIFMGITIIIPFINILAKSFSSSTNIVSGAVKLLPKGFGTVSYQYILESGVFFTALKNSVFVVAVGTVLNVLVTAMVAYPLANSKLKGRRFFIALYMFTMVFDVGIIPNYLLVKKLGLMNSLWSLIIPGLVWTYNMLILKSYFESLPKEIEESVMVDGGGFFRYFFQFVIPLSKPTLATVALFYGVSHWTDYYKALLYITSVDKKPLQLLLYEIIVQSASVGDVSTFDLGQIVSPEGVRCATIVLSVIPMLIVYPFVQKYFTSGVTLGAVKE